MIESWRELLINAANELGYTTDQVREILAKRYPGKGHTKQYDLWWAWLVRRKEIEEKDKLLDEWALIWNMYDDKPEPMRMEWTIDKMKEHIERYRNEKR